MRGMRKNAKPRKSSSDDTRIWVETSIGDALSSPSSNEIIRATTHTNSNKKRALTTVPTSRRADARPETNPIEAQQLEPCMSKAKDTFAQSIKDAENLLQHFNDLNKKPPPAPELEVLKRAGLVMAMTAWETYVEDRVLEACTERLRDLSDRTVAEFVQSKLDEEIKKLHNPASQRTLQLFREYAGVDLANYWFWNGWDFRAVTQRLDDYMKLRGDVVHRSLQILPDAQLVHPVKKDDLKKAIAFLKNLVVATERSLEQPTG